jgi:hypothetical protein
MSLGRIFWCLHGGENTQTRTLTQARESVEIYKVREFNEYYYSLPT